MKTVYLLFAAAIGVTLAAFAEKQPFERYQTIIDRMPFGQPPPGFDPTRNPDEVSKNDYQQSAEELTQEQEELQKAVQFSVINVDPNGTVRVGFSDKSDPSAPRHYYMAVGEERNGWMVKEADPAEKSMTVEKDGVEVALKLGENSGGDAKGAGAKGRTARTAARPVASPSARKSSLLARPSAGDAGKPPEPESYRGRRERREAEEAERRREAAREAAEREAEREARAAKEAEEKAAREAERAEQREQLKAIQEELRRAREEQAKARENSARADGDGDEEADDADED